MRQQKGRRLTELMIKVSSCLFGEALQAVFTNSLPPCLLNTEEKQSGILKCISENSVQISGLKSGTVRAIETINCPGQDGCRHTGAGNVGDKIRHVRGKKNRLNYFD